MPNYGKAFLKGIEAAKKAEEKRIEIESILEEFSNEIKSVTDEAIEIKKREFYVEPSNPFSVSLLSPRETYTVLVAKNIKVTDDKYQKLAIWKESRDGYPCIIEYNGKKIIAEDKVALEASLEEMLEDSLVGERLFKAVSYSNKEE